MPMDYIGSRDIKRFLKGWLTYLLVLLSFTYLGISSVVIGVIYQTYLLILGGSQKLY